MDISPIPTILDIDVYTTSTTAGMQVGQQAMDSDGNLYRYGKSGAGSTAGKLQVTPAPNTDHHNIAVSAAVAIGATEVPVTFATTAIDAGEYDGGYLVVNDGTGEGHRYKISHTPAATAAAGAATIVLADPIKVALDTTSEVTLFHNTYLGFVEAAVEERRPAGVPLVDIASGSYGWVQVKGIASVLQGDNTNVGEMVVQHASTAGAVDAASTTYGTAFAYYEVGKAAVAGVSGEYNPVDLTIG